MKIPHIFDIAEIVTQVLMLLLIFKSYPVWLGTIFFIFLVLLFYLRKTMILEVPPPRVHVRDSTVIVLFDDEGELVHVIKSQDIRPLKGTTVEHIDRGLVGTGKITNFKSFQYVESEDDWKECKISSIKIEGGELAVITFLAEPISDNTWTKRKFEFDCVNCFLEKEESFKYRVDNYTDLFKMEFNFSKNRSPKEINVFEFLVGNKRLLSTIKPSLEKGGEFEYSLNRPHLGSDYIFSWKWRESKSPLYKKTTLKEPNHS